MITGLLTKPDLNNERGGAALIMAIITSVVITFTLSTIYIYIENNAEYHQRIRSAYQGIGIMEQLAKQIRTAYDLGERAGGPGGCPAGTLWDATSPRPLCIPNTNGGQFCTEDIYGQSYCYQFSTSMNHRSMEVKKYKGYALFNKKWKKRLDNFIYGSKESNNYWISLFNNETYIERPSFNPFASKYAYAQFIREDNKNLSTITIGGGRICTLPLVPDGNGGCKLPGDYGNGGDSDTVKCGAGKLCIVVPEMEEFVYRDCAEAPGPDDWNCADCTGNRCIESPGNSTDKPRQNFYIF